MGATVEGGVFVTPYYERAGVTIYLGRAEDVLPTLEPTSVDLLLTDPPYNVRDFGARANTTERMVKRADGSRRIVPQHFGEWDSGWNPLPLLAQAERLLHRNGAILAFTADRLVGAFLDGPLTHKRLLVWRKTNPMPAFNRTYPIDTEWIVWKSNGGSPTFNGTHQDSTVYTGPIAPGASRVHPNQKPLWLLQGLLKRHSVAGNLILDPYMGSGTTLVAAKLMGRQAIGIEINERHCESAAKRLSQDVMPLELPA